MLKNCKTCDIQYKIKPSHYNKSFYCSRKCMAIDYKNRLKSVNNPNFKNRLSKKCQNCDELIKNYSSKKYCSHQCYFDALRKNKKIKPITIKKAIKQKHIPNLRPPQKIITCLSCKTKFLVNNKSRRKYCSRNCYSIVGENNPNWKGGVQTLSQMIRGSKRNRLLIKNTLKKDNFTCQRCGVRGGSLQVDHFIPFSIIYEEFIDSYKFISQQDDVYILFELAQDFYPFWDDDNFRVLCKSCNWKREMLIRKINSKSMEHIFCDDENQLMTVLKEIIDENVDAKIFQINDGFDSAKEFINQQMEEL